MMVQECQKNCTKASPEKVSTLVIITKDYFSKKI